jgi:D-amino-acid oxidase
MNVPDVLVIGAGVAGLTTAVRIAESGRSVRLIADRESLTTTSSAAGASWSPSAVDDHRMLEWAKASRVMFEHIAGYGTRTGVRLTRGLETDVRLTDPPSWAAEIADFELCPPNLIPPGYASGWHYTIPIVNMRAYLAYLNERLAEFGVHVEIDRVASFADWAAAARSIVNCTGLGARELVPDPMVFPTRGQLLVVRNFDHGGIDQFFQDNPLGSDLTYYFPHGDHVVLGGCAVEYAADEKPDPDIAEGIRKRCGAIEPRILQMPIIEDRVGLRPTRAEVRVEREERDGTTVIHNYGHSGNGVTLSWGCAEEVCRLLG